MCVRRAATRLCRHPPPLLNVPAACVSVSACVCAGQQHALLDAEQAQRAAHPPSKRVHAWGGMRGTTLCFFPPQTLRVCVLACCIEMQEGVHVRVGKSIHSIEQVQHILLNIARCALALSGTKVELRR